MLKPEDFLFPEDTTTENNTGVECDRLPHQPHHPFINPPSKPRYTMQEEIQNTMRRVNETVARVLKIRKDLDEFIKTLTTDNVEFKNLCINTYNEFSESIIHELTVFQTDITNAYNGLSDAYIQNQDEFREAVEDRLAKYNESYTKAFNDYVKGMNDLFAETNNRYNSNYEAFVSQVNENYTNFKNSVETRLDGQDSVIADAKLYMTTNLGVELSKLLDEMAIMGKIDVMTNSAYNKFNSKKITKFVNVAEMRSSDSAVGHTVQTLGYYSEGDGGSARYYIREAVGGEVDNGGSVIILDNGCVASLIPDVDGINVLQFGADGSGVADSSTAFNNAFSFMSTFVTGGASTDIDGGGILHYGRSCKVNIPKGAYIVKNVEINGDYIEIEGNNATIHGGETAFIINGGWKTVVKNLIFVNHVTAIKIVGANLEMGNLIIENCEFIACTSHGIHITYKQSYLGMIERCRFFKCNYALEQTGCDLLVMRNCWISEHVKTKDFDSTILTNGGELQVDSCLFVPYPSNGAECCWIEGNSNITVTKSHFGAEAGSKPVIRATNKAYRYTISDCQCMYSAIGNCLILVSGGFEGITIKNTRCYYDDMVPVRISSTVTDPTTLYKGGSFIVFEHLYGNRTLTTECNRWGLIPTELKHLYKGDPLYLEYKPVFNITNNYGDNVKASQITTSFGTAYPAIYPYVGELILHVEASFMSNGGYHKRVMIDLLPTYYGAFATYTPSIHGDLLETDFTISYPESESGQQIDRQINIVLTAGENFQKLSIDRVSAEYMEREGAIYPWG